MFTSKPARSAARGFTLVELLVVVLLIGFGLGVGLTVDFAASPQQQKQQTALLANALELAAQEAVLDDRILGLDFFTANEAFGYRWLQLREGTWHPFTTQADTLQETLLAREFSAALVLAGQEHVVEARVDLADAAGFSPASPSTFRSAFPGGVTSVAPAFAPEVTLLPTRELTPFTLSIGGNDGDASVLSADLMGRIRVDADAPTPP